MLTILWKKVKEKPMEIALALLLAIQVFLIALSNLTLIDQNLDPDVAKLLKHAIAMWEEKTLAIPEWIYVSTLELDCTTLLALPLYGLTKNIFLASSLSNIILTLIFIRVIFLLFEGNDPLYPLMCANLICIPYRVGTLDYYNMMFFSGAQYIVKVSIPLLLIGLLLLAEREKNLTKNRRFWIFSALYLILLAVSSLSSGVYVVACGLIPVFAVYLFYKFIIWKRVPVPVFILFGLSFLCISGGMTANKMILGETKAGSMVFCSLYATLDNVTSCFFGLFELIGGNTTDFDFVIFSVDGIIMLSKCCLMIAFLICGAFAFVKCVKKRGDLRLKLLLSVFVWNYFILNVSSTRYGAITFEYRYHLMGLIPLMCVTVVIMIQWFRNLSNIQQKWLFWSVFAAFLVFQSMAFREVFIRGEQNSSIKELVAYVDDTDLEAVYVYYPSGAPDICRLLDGDRLYLEVNDEGITPRVLDYYGQYIGAPVMTENAIVAVSGDKGDRFELGGYSMIRFDSVDIWTLYYFAN